MMFINVYQRLDGSQYCGKPRHSRRECEQVFEDARRWAPALRRRVCVLRVRLR